MPEASTPELPWADIRDHAEKIHHVIKERTPKSIETTVLNENIVQMFWRAVRLYDGVLLLLNHQLPEEAAILARSLFDVSVNLQQLEAEPSNRAALIFGWINRSLNEQVGLLKKCNAPLLGSHLYGSTSSMSLLQSASPASHSQIRVISDLSRSI